MLRAKCLKALIYKGKPCNHLRLQGFFFGAEGEIRTLARFLDDYSLSRGAPSASWVLPQVELWYHIRERIGGESGIRTHGTLLCHWFSRPAP